MMKIPENLKGMRVLIVFDDRLYQLMTSYLINMWKGSADLASDWEMAFKMVTENIYDVVLLDTIMPIMGGFEATRQIRSMKGEYFRNLPIIIVSRIPDYEMMRESGVTDFISMDSPKEELYAFLKRFLK